MEGFQCRCIFCNEGLIKLNIEVKRSFIYRDLSRNVQVAIKRALYYNTEEYHYSVRTNSTFKVRFAKVTFF